MKSLIFSLLLVGCVSAIDVKFEDCGSVLGKGVKVSVTPCETQPCQLKHGSNYTVGLTFTPDAPSAKIQAIIHGVVDGIPVPFPFDQPDACQNSGLTCPLTSGQSVTYTASLPVKSSYPAIKLFVKWELEDMDKKQDIVCVEIPVAVVSVSNDKVVSRHWFED